VFGRLDREPSANARELAAALRARGVREEPPGRFSDGAMTIDLIEVVDDRAAVDAALAAVLDRDLVCCSTVCARTAAGASCSLR
jgi:hypothetical protein